MDTTAELARICEALNRLIAASGISRAELDKQLGGARGYVSRILSGKRRLTVGQLLEILDALGIHPADLCATLYPPKRRAFAPRDLPAADVLAALNIKPGPEPKEGEVEPPSPPLTVDDVRQIAAGIVEELLARHGLAGGPPAAEPGTETPPGSSPPRNR